MTALLLAALLAAPQGGEACTRDSEGFCVDPLVRTSLSYKNPDPRVRINAALGDVVSIELPAHVALRAEPSLGNDSIFKILTQESRGEGEVQKTDLSGEASPKGLILLLWTHVPAGAGDIQMSDILGQQSNLHLFLDGGLTVTIELRVGRRGKSVQRLVFDFPERDQETSYVHQLMNEERRALYSEHETQKKELEKTVEDSSNRRLARSLMKRLHCDRLTSQAMRDLLIVRADRLCRIGDDIYIDFAIKNRARDLFSLKNVEVVAEGKDTAEPIRVEYDGTPSVLLGYNGETRGVAVFSVDDATAARSYTLKVTESGGKKRVVAVNDVSF